MSAFTRWRFGMNFRLVMAVMCVPMPPAFFALPLRQMMLPLRGPTPVISQILAITILSQIKGAKDSRAMPRGKHFFGRFCVQKTAPSVSSRRFLWPH
jgi:hypothetical protein